MSIQYIETQRFTAKARRSLILLTAAILTFAGFLLTSPATFHLPVHGAPPPAAFVVTVLLAVFAFLLWMLGRMSLVVTVDRGEARFEFTPYKPLVVPLADIARAEVVTYRALRDCGGVGMRYGYKLKGRSFTVSGDRGVEIETRAGKLVLVGTQRPEELLKALTEVRNLEFGMRN